MAIPFTGTGGLFTRIGTIGTLVDATDVWNGTTIPTDTQLILNQYVSNEPLYDGISPAVGAYQQSAGNMLVFLQQIAQATCVFMANDDVLLPNSLLSTALTEIIRQMNAGVVTVQSATMSIAVSPGSVNTTNGRVVTSLFSPYGILQENAYAELIAVSVSNDAITGTATKGQETILFQGGISEPDQLSYLWPAGSGASLSISAIDSQSSTSNMLLNGGFESWTANSPDSWTLVVGTPGVTVFKTTAHVYQGTAAFQFTSDGAQHLKFKQAITSIAAVTQYAINFWLGFSGIPGAGVLTVSLVDQSGAVITDQAAIGNTDAVILAGAPTAYTPHAFVFRTPLLMPTTTYLQFEITTPLTNTVQMYLDSVGFGAMQQLYSGGPYFAAFSGSHQFTSLDVFTVTLANNYGGAGSFQAIFNREFTMLSLGLLLPTSGTPSIPNY